MLLEAVEVCRPELPIRGEPVVQFRERLGADAVEPPLGVGTRLDQTGVFKHAEVLRDRRLADAEALDEIANRPFAVAEQVEDLQPARLCEGFECGELGHKASMTTQLYARQEIEALRSACSTARASSTRFATPTLRKMFRRCVSTVFGLRNSSPAISGFVFRSTTSRAS